MGIFDFKKSKEPSKEILPEPTPNQVTEKNEIFQDNKEDFSKLKFDLMLSEIENVKTQIQMVNERLKMIEKKLDQRTTIRYV